MPVSRTRGARPAPQAAAQEQLIPMRGSRAYSRASDSFGERESYFVEKFSCCTDGESTVGYTDSPRKHTTLEFKNKSALAAFNKNVLFLMAQIDAFIHAHYENEFSSENFELRFDSDNLELVNLESDGICKFRLADFTLLLTNVGLKTLSYKLCKEIVGQMSDDHTDENIVWSFQTGFSAKDLDAENVSFYKESPTEADERVTETAVEAQEISEDPETPPTIAQAAETVVEELIEQVGDAQEPEFQHTESSRQPPEPIQKKPNNLNCFYFSQAVKPKLTDVKEKEIKDIDSVTSEFASYGNITKKNKAKYKALAELLHKGTQRLINSDLYMSNAVFVIVPIQAPNSSLRGSNILLARNPEDKKFIDAVDSSKPMMLRLGVMNKEIMSWQTDPKIKQQLITQFAKGLVRIFDISDPDFDLDYIDVLDEMGI